MQKRQRRLCQVVLLTAIPAEYQAVRRHLKEPREMVYKGTVYEKGLFLAEGGTCEVGIAQISAGNARAAAEAERAIAFFNPSIAFFVGVAGGIKDVKLGDVVVATKVYGYEAGKAENTFRPRPEVGQTAYALVQRAQAEARRFAWLDRLGVAIPQPPPHVIVAPIAAGEKVQASTRSATYRLIRANYGDAVAVEMEGHGFLLALHANPEVGALVIRGISDLIDGKKEADAEHFQEKAAAHASAFAFEVLAKLINQPQGEANDDVSPDPILDILAHEPSYRGSNQYHQQHQGPNSGIVQQGGNNSIHNIIMNAPKKDEDAKGKTYLLRGQSALQHGDYLLARQHLTEAARLLNEDHVPAEGAQVRFLQAMASLEGKRPFGLTLTAMRRVDQLMEGALALHPTYAYLYTFALFKRDFSRNRWQESQYLRKSQVLEKRAQETQFTLEDKENLALLSKCQPRLIQDAQQW